MVIVRCRKTGPIRATLSRHIPSFLIRLLPLQDHEQRDNIYRMPSAARHRLKKIADDEEVSGRNQAWAKGQVQETPRIDGNEPESDRCRPDAQHYTPFLPLQ